MPRTGKRRWPKPPPCLPDSAHRWRLETPNGPTVLGVCAHCHAEHAFPSSDAEDWAWKSDIRTPAERRALARKASAASHR